MELRLPDITLHVEDHGSGQETIVFSHGLLMSHQMFAPQLESFGDRYRCISYDHRGQGRSQVPTAPLIDMEVLTQDAAALIEQLGAGPCHFVGLSMGGFVGMRLAARHPELIRSLTLIATAPDPEPAANVPKYRLLTAVSRIAGTRAVASQVMPILFGPSFLDDPLRRDLRQRWRQHLEDNGRSVYKAVNGVIYRAGVERELPRIQCPTLVLWGTEDQAIARHRAEKILTLMPERAEMKIIPRAGHSTTIENPEEVNRALEGFLRAV